MPTSNWDKTTANDRPEVVITDETNGYNAGVTSDERLKVTTDDFYLDIAQGIIDGVSHINKFGNNPTVSNAAFEEIWDESVVYTYPTSAATLEVTSDDADDTNTAGTGARQVEIQGLNSSYALITETVNLNGTADVTTSNSYLRVFRMRVISSGTSGTNEGKITATHNGTSTVVAAIQEEVGQSLMAIYTIPASKTGYLYDYYISSEESLGAQLHLMSRPFGEAWQIKHHQEVGTGAFQYTYKVPLKLTEKTDVSVTSRAATGNHSTSSGFTIILFDN